MHATSRPERRHIQQIAFPSMEAAEQAAPADRAGHELRGNRQGAGQDGKRHRSRYCHQGRHDRPRRCRWRLRAQGGRSQCSDPGEIWAGSCPRAQDRAEQVRSFEDVADELKQELATSRAKAEVLKLYDKIEDARAEGKSLAEIAEQLKVPVRTVEAVDRSGRDASGLPIKLPDEQRLLEAAFTTDVAVERDPLQFQNGYIWYDVLSITPSRERTLDEVKDQVEQRWREQEIASRLSAKAAEILEKVQAGSSLADAATTDHLKSETLTGLKRSESKAPLSTAAVEAVFRTPKDGVGKADAAKAPEQVVFRVTEIVVPSLDMQSADAKRVVEALNRAVSEEVAAEYIAHLEAENGVSINQNALNQVTGSQAGSSDVD